MPYVVCDGVRLYYEVHGSGTPLILISGLGGDRNFWAASVPILQKHFQVVIFDNRGIGRSDAPDAPYSMELFADDVACLMDEIGVPAAHLLGFSMGGCIAQKFAARYPNRLRKLIIAASFARMNRQAELFLDAVLSVYEGGATPKQMFDLIAPWLFSAAFLNDPQNAAYLQFDENDPELQPLYAFRRQYLAQKAFDSRSELHAVQAPTLVLAGERDALVSVEDAQGIVERIAGARLQIIPGAGHLVNLENDERFHAAVIEFLSEGAAEV